MKTIQIATRVDERQNQHFREIAAAIGITPSDALRMFIAAFIAERGFPYDVKAKAPVQAFDNEEDATAFATSLAKRTLHETW